MSLRKRAQVAQRAARKQKSHPSLFLADIIPAVTIMMVTHSLEVMVWSLAYWIVGAAPAGAGRVYFAFVNYVTLGGDIVPVERWPALGAF